MEQTCLAFWPAPMAEDIRTQDRHLEALMRLLEIPVEQATLQEHIQWMQKSFDDASSFGRVLIIKHVETDTIVGVALLVPMYTLTSGRCGTVENMAISQELDDRERQEIADLLIAAIVEEAKRIDMRRVFVDPQNRHEILTCVNLNFEDGMQDERMVLDLQPTPSGQEP